MGAAADKLIGLMQEPDPYAHPDEEIVPLQVEAIGERLAERRDQIPVLDQRATDLGLSAITGLADVVPLLFAHTTYKSYPEAFVERGRWDRMCQWLGTLSALPLGAVELDGISDVDDWMARLRAAGHFVFASSGTTGKCSFLDQSAGDREVTSAIQLLNMRWALGVEARRDRPAFLLGPSRGAHRFVDAFAAVADNFGRPDATYFLSDEPATAAEANRLGSLRRAIAEGRATPSEIAALDTFAAERQRQMQDALLALVDAILEHRREPMILMGMWQQHWLIMQEAHARGIPDGEFHPDTAITTGGGLKGTELPDDHQEQIRRFYGLDRSRFQGTYGMVEMSSTWPSCIAGRYHRPPWIALLVLDKEGEHLSNQSSGEVDGRMAFFDVTTEARWGGLISGDNVTADFSPCACGRPGPTITSVARYADLAEGDDKLTCAGTMDSYVRGVMDA